ncbi:MAG: hypothetical protein Q9166_001755 [cf. Caloplaca sp. 2 TL-2023]
MQPGRVYVGRLPNHNGPVFVRKRRKSFANPFGIPSVTSIFAPPQIPQLDYQYSPTAVYRPQPPPSDLRGTTTAIRWHRERTRVRHCAGSARNSIPLVKSSMRSNEHDGRRGSVGLAKGGVTDPILLTNGLVLRARKSGRGITGTGLQTTVRGIGDLVSQVLVPVQGSTSSDSLKSDVDNLQALPKMSA